MIGGVSEATAADIDRAADRAAKAQPAWDALGGPGRARILCAMGDALEADMDRLVALLAREGGKTLNDGVAEVREAVDFCRYYAVLAEKQFAGLETLKGPVGETNQLELYVFTSDKRRQAVLVARLDNLGKGASGAAVQNMRLMLGLAEV